MGVRGSYQARLAFPALGATFCQSARKRRRRTPGNFHSQLTSWSELISSAPDFNSADALNRTAIVRKAISAGVTLLDSQAAQARAWRYGPAARSLPTISIRFARRL